MLFGAYFGVQRIIRKTRQRTWFPRPTEVLPLISLVANLTDYGKVVFVYLTASDICRVSTQQHWEDEPHLP